ncbi:Glycosyltransferase sugar-binding region containing DXD motif-containing protein [Pedobacter westerhofensis]|uniref:Glycosyltransferase sugar-binding region containing DXD motif-containing protein n=1 Tax=Pedobacter westerhofensis TaxID=425512 RepID=A0A521EKN9_9SPHI|nr:glycosyltransferase [Pedobacter westerhofensis]SMO83710.1 Glycosyltransferase sugar-binding region containing DXD motif-containing protein [Pedobacter westerhofensis]
MSIPKIIHQTFKSSKLPFLTRWHISGFRKKNPEYAYEFYDDARIAVFLQEEFGAEVFELYSRLNIGAAKADFFRYAVLYKKGGIYVDIDSGINSRLDDFIRADDVAVITREGDPTLYAQWALIYSPGHPFLEKTIEMVLSNIRQDKYPHDVHRMTGPTVYTLAIDDCLKNNPQTPHRLLGTDYNGHLKVKYKLGKFFLYEKGDHWKKKQLTTPVLKPQ